MDATSGRDPASRSTTPPGREAPRVGCCVFASRKRTVRLARPRARSHPFPDPVSLEASGVQLHSCRGKWKDARAGLDSINASVGGWVPGPWLPLWAENLEALAGSSCSAQSAQCCCSGGHGPVPPPRREPGPGRWAVIQQRSRAQSAQSLPDEPDTPTSVYKHGHPSSIARLPTHLLLLIPLVLSHIHARTYTPVASRPSVA